MRTAAAFDPLPDRLEIWRAVEAQHRTSTMVLVDSLDEQTLLESILDASKPAGDAPQTLHWLLFTPFRYPPLPRGSRFRATHDPGVFYGASERRTACAELGYWRWRFLRDSVDTKLLQPVPQTLFLTQVSGSAINLQAPPLVSQRSRWTNPGDYSHCQALARRARDQGIAMIHYESVRDPEHAQCTAVLTHQAFATSKPSATQTWMMAVFHDRVLCKRDSVYENEAFEFSARDWKS